jgi:hypothetical protein
LSPASGDLNPIYTRGEGEVGAVTFTLRNNNGENLEDKVVVNFPPIVNAGLDQTLCSSLNINVKLSGSIATSGSGVTWKSPTNGIFFFSGDSLKPRYTITLADKANKEVLITLSTGYSNAACPVITDTVKITIDDRPTVYAGDDRKICESWANIQLAGTSTSSPVKWTTLSGTEFANSLNTTYNLTPADQSSESIKLVLTALATNSCPAVSDTILIGLIRLPHIQALFQQQFVILRQA